MRKLLAALAALLLILVAMPYQAGAAAGGHMNRDCLTGPMDTSPFAIRKQSAFSFCPSTAATLTAMVDVESMADCNWNADTSGSGAGTVTLSAKKCTGTTTAANDCKNPLTDSADNTTITSGSDTGYFSLDAGLWLITASATAADGRLVCSGR